MIRWLAFALVVIAATVVVILGWPWQSFAADAPADCPNTVASLLAELTKPPVAEVADNVPIRAVHFDQIILVNYHGHQFMWLARAGCIVAAPVDVGTLPEPDPALPAPAPSIAAPPKPDVPDVST